MGGPQKNECSSVSKWFELTKLKDYIQNTELMLLTKLVLKAPSEFTFESSTADVFTAFVNI